MLSKSRSLAVVLYVFLAFAGIPKAAKAECLPANPVDGDLVLCDDATVSTGFDAGVSTTGLDVTTTGNAVMDDSDPGFDSAIRVGDGNDIRIRPTATVNVTGVGGFGITGVNDNTILNEGTINVEATAVGGIGINVADDNLIENEGTINIDAAAIGGIGINAANSPSFVMDSTEIVNSGVITIGANDGVGIRVGELYEVDNEAGGVINVQGDDAFGIRGDADNFVRNLGTINVNGLDGRAISVGENLTGFTINQAGNGALSSFEIFLNADRSVGIEGGEGSGLANTGLIQQMRNDTIGVLAADRTNYDNAANISNSGILDIMGDDSFGIMTGDGWVDGTVTMADGLVPTASGVFNFLDGVINVDGPDSVGIFAGNAANMNNNSFVTNLGQINVMGTDAVGVSVGGNDLLGRFDLNDVAGSLNVFSLENSSDVAAGEIAEIIGGPNAGPLVEFHGFVVGQENRLRNSTGSRIIADNVNMALPDRFVAIRGTDGDEFIANFGEISGDIELMDGDDRYVHGEGATFNVLGTIRGGNGFDELILVDNSNPLETFNVSVLEDFEEITIAGGTSGWALSNADLFTGLTRIRESGRLQVPLPLELGGDFVVDPAGTLELTIDPADTALVIRGASTFDGTLLLTPVAGLTAGPTPIRAIDAVGGYTGTFQFVSGGINIFDVTYDTTGVLVQLVASSLVGVAQGSNQRSIAQHLVDVTAVGATSQDLQDLLDEIPTSSGLLANVFNALNPEIYDAHTTTVVEGGRRIMSLLFDRPRECPTGSIESWRRPDTKLSCHGRQRWAPWLAPIGSIRNREGFNGHSEYDATLGGLVFGIDFQPIESLDLTVAVSSQRGTIDGDGSGSSTITLTDLSGHAAWRNGPLRIQGAVTWGHGFHQNRRRIRFAETDTVVVDARGVSEHDSDRISIAAEAGFEFDVGPVKIEPIGGLDWAWVYQRPIHEDEAGGFGARIESRDDEIGSLSAGVRLSTAYEHSRYIAEQLVWLDGTWRPTAEFRWRQLLTETERSISGRLQGAPDTVPGFEVEGEEDDGGVELAAGVSFTPKNANRLQIDVRYEAFIAPHTVQHDLVGRVSIGF